MKLLILTQKVDVDDPVLGFFHRWIEEFSKNCEFVTVVCLQKGKFALPKNVKVLSLGKENGISRIKYLLNFYKYIWQERKNYDEVFVHMNPIYATLGGFFWRFYGKKIALWYTHKRVDVKLRIAVLLSDLVFSASKESFRLKTRKLHIVGHGIDLEKFAPWPRSKENIYRILSVGRISKTKNNILMVGVVRELSQKGHRVELVLVGSGITNEEKLYERKLKELVEEKKLGAIVRFEGGVSPGHIVSHYHNADMFINLSETGSLDKAVLEAMACGLQIVTSNEAFRGIVPKENFIDREALDVSRVADRVMELSRKLAPPSAREYMVQNHNIENLIPRIVDKLKRA